MRVLAREQTISRILTIEAVLASMAITQEITIW